MAYPAGARNISTNSSLPKEKIKSGSYVKPGGKATGNMKDYALNTQARRDEYTARGWKQDKTTEIKSSTPTASKPSTVKKEGTQSGVKSSGNPNGVRLGGPKSGAAYDRVNAYANNPANFKGKSQADAMQNNRGSNSKINSNIKGNTSDVSKISMQNVNAAENKVANNKAVGKNSNIAKLTSSNIDKTLDTKSSGGEVSKSALVTQGAHTYAQASGINPTAGAKSKLDGLVTGLDKKSSYANLDSSPGKTAISQMRQEAASGPKQTTLGSGGGSGMGQAHAMNMSMASTINKATDKKGLFEGLKQRRAEKKTTTPDPSLTTLKQKDATDTPASSSAPSSGYIDSQNSFRKDMEATFGTGSESSEASKIYQDERSKYL